jgi:hypothetical protein
VRKSKAEAELDAVGYHCSGQDNKGSDLRPSEEFKMTRERRVPGIASIDRWMDVAFTG